MQCKREENLENCTCSFPDCPRKGMCCECVMHHRKKNEIPACFFSVKSEADYDRTIEHFIKGHREYKKQIAKLKKKILEERSKKAIK